jgi:hypothetical protein
MSEISKRKIVRKIPNICTSNNTFISLNKTPQVKEKVSKKLKNILN